MIKLGTMHFINYTIAGSLAVWLMVVASGCTDDGSKDGASGARVAVQAPWAQQEPVPQPVPAPSEPKELAPKAPAQPTAPLPPARPETKDPNAAKPEPTSPTSAQTSPPPQPAAPSAPSPTGGDRLPDFASVYEKVSPSVVRVLAQSTRGLESGTSMGSGFFFGDKGLILTNNHVVAGASQVRIVTQDGKEATAQLLGSDELIDLALLKVTGLEPMPAALTAAAESDIRVGSWVMAIGHPIDLEFSATKGVISALDRSDIGSDRFTLANYIQTDAAINRGNSGGPLVDAEGKVVGVCTLVRADGDRIGFAIPITQAAEVARHLEKFGRLVRAWMGIEIAQTPEGIRIGGVFPEGPAAKAGIKPGDMVVSLDGQEMKLLDRLRWSVAVHSTSTPARLKIRRDNKEIEVEVKLEAAPPMGRAQRR